MTRDETADAALLHARELPHEFLIRFGPGFLNRYYKAFVESPYAVALAARVNDEESTGGSGGLDGVLIGTFDTKAHYSHLVRRHGLGLGLNALLQVGKRPQLAGELLRTRLLRYLRGILRALSYTTGSGAKSHVDRGGDSVGFVTYVAVDGSRRGHGIGGRLLEAYEELAREVGMRRLELVTLPDERGAAPFFDSMGWRREGEITSRSGERYALFTRDLVGEESEA